MKKLPKHESSAQNKVLDLVLQQGIFRLKMWKQQPSKNNRTTVLHAHFLLFLLYIAFIFQGM